MTESKYSNITTEDILALQKGEVIRYEREEGEGWKYLHVDRIDTERGVVCGEVTFAPGVNAIPIEELVKGAIDIAKWQDREKK